MDRRKNRQRILILLTVIAFLLLAIASTQYWFRADLSSGKAFSLSSVSKNLHREIPEQLRITYYISSSLEKRHPGPGQIKDLLSEMAALSHGKISFRAVDPGSDASKAESFGLYAQQMQVVEKSEQRVALVYSGIVMEYLDRFQSIPVILDSSTLEYEMLKSIRMLVKDSILKAGLLVGDSDKSIQNDYRYLASALQQAAYEVEEVHPGSEIPLDTSVLFVLGNADLDRYDAWFIDDFIMKGGKVFFAVKGVNILTSYGLDAEKLEDSGLLHCLEYYGFQITPELVLDRQNLTVPFQMSGPMGGVSISYVRYPHWIALDGKYANTDHALSSRFSGLDLFWPSPLILNRKSGVEYTELFKTSPGAWKMSRDLLVSPEYESLFGMEQGESTGQYLVAATASGNIPGAFAVDSLPEREGYPELKKGATKSMDSRLVIVSSADFLTDLVQMSQSGFNIDFAVNAADWLSSEDDLVAIRSRANLDTRLNRIQDEASKSAMIIFTYTVTLGLVPLLVILYGVMRSWKRRKLESLSRREQRNGGDA